jgi:hypothetical protein
VTCRSASFSVERRKTTDRRESPIHHLCSAVFAVFAFRSFHLVMPVLSGSFKLEYHDKVDVTIRCYDYDHRSRSRSTSRSRSRSRKSNRGGAAPSGARDEPETETDKPDAMTQACAEAAATAAAAAAVDVVRTLNFVRQSASICGAVGAIGSRPGTTSSSAPSSSAASSSAANSS